MIQWKLPPCHLWVTEVPWVNKNYHDWDITKCALPLFFKNFASHHSRLNICNPTMYRDSVIIHCGQIKMHIKFHMLTVAKAHLLHWIMCYISQSDFSWEQILPKRWLSRWRDLYWEYQMLKLNTDWLVTWVSAMSLRACWMVQSYHTWKTQSGRVDSAGNTTTFNENCTLHLRKSIGFCDLGYLRH